MYFVAFYVAVFLKFMIQPTASESHGFNPNFLDDRTDNLSQFGRELYQFSTSSDVFQKVFDISLTADRAGDSFYKNAVYFSDHLYLHHPGSIRIQIALAAADAFYRGMTPVKYFKVFSNTVEEFLTRSHILTEENVKQLAYTYYREIERVLREVEANNNPDFLPAAVYELTAGSANFYNLFRPVPHEIVRHSMAFFAYEWNNVVGTSTVKECMPHFHDIYSSYYDFCTPSIFL